jgi:hypothetical protein
MRLLNHSPSHEGQVSKIGPGLKIYTAKRTAEIKDPKLSSIARGLPEHRSQWLPAILGSIEGDRVSLKRRPTISYRQRRRLGLIEDLLGIVAVASGSSIFPRGEISCKYR